MTCPTCQAEMKLIPAGVSKATGKPYGAFMACPNKCPKPNGFRGNTPAPVHTPFGEAWGKCKTLALLEDYKKYGAVTPENEATAEDFATRCMRKMADKKPPLVDADEINIDGIPF